jgi:hypothetical protein
LQIVANRVRKWDVLGISRPSSEETGLQEVERMSWDVVLPAFEMDCRDWLVVTPSPDGLPEEVGGAPLLAVLSTAVFDETNFQSASGVLTIGWLDDESREHYRAGVAELLDPDGPADGEPGGWTMRYLVPSPDRQLGLLAEFSLGDHPELEVLRRVEALMASFRWAL